MSELSGFFLAVEGGEGAGKTTLVEGLAEYFEAQGYLVTVTSDPSGCELGRQIGGLLGNASAVNDPMTAMLLLTAARRQLIETVIRPALAAGHIVLCERYVHWTLVQQGVFGDFAADAPLRMHAEACDDLWPHITILLDADPSVTLNRTRPDLTSHVVERAALPVYEAVAAAYRQSMRYTPEGDYGIVAAGNAPAIILADTINMVAVNDHFERYLERQSAPTHLQLARA